MEFSTAYQSSTLSSWYQKRLIISEAMQYRKRTVLREADKRNNKLQSIPFVDTSRDDDARSCLGTADHASGCIPIALASLSEKYPRLSYLLFGQDRKYRRKIRDIQTKKSTVKSSTGSKKLSVTLRGRIAYFAQSKPSLVVGGQLAVSQTTCERRLVLLKLLLHRCRLPRRLVEAK